MDKAAAVPVKPRHRHGSDAPNAQTASCAYRLLWYRQLGKGQSRLPPARRGRGNAGVCGRLRAFAGLCGRYYSVHAVQNNLSAP